MEYFTDLTLTYNTIFPSGKLFTFTSGDQIHSIDLLGPTTGYRHY